MDESGSPGSGNDDRDVPIDGGFQWDQSPMRGDPPTHWNVSRNPRTSFACPFCGNHVRFVVHPDLDGENVVAMCSPCNHLIGWQQWRYYKEMQV